MEEVKDCILLEEELKFRLLRLLQKERSEYIQNHTGDNGIITDPGDGAEVLNI